MFTKEELEAIDKLPYLAENGRWKINGNSSY